MMNPLLQPTSQPIPFNRLTVNHITEATETIINHTKDKIDLICQVNQPHFNNTMKALDTAYAELSQVFGTLYLLAYVHPEKKLREAALSQIPEIEKYMNSLSMHEQLYRSVKRWAGSPAGRQLKGYKKRFTDEEVQAFERNGLGLSQEKRQQVKQLKDELSQLGVAFDTHIASYEDTLELNEEQMSGLDEEYKLARKTDKGTYLVDLSYPSYRPFMKLAHNENARKQLMFKFLNRASEANLPVLDKILQKRQELAQLLGFQSFAEYNLQDKMARTPQQVWEFEETLQKNIQTKARHDYQELLETKQQLTGKQVQVVQPWETAYLSNILLKEKYAVDQEKLKEYFPLNQVLQGLFDLSKRLFGIHIVNQDLPVWHPEVTAYEVFENGKLKGRFYLDLFPRSNKFKHAASFPMVQGRETDQGYQLPLATLVCNFPKPTANTPSLLPHEEVVTLFHEFGHLLHDILTQAPLSAQAGTSVSRDFVETPSQLFENWAWEYESLQLFAHHYQTGELLPKTMHQRMIDARNVGSGIHTLQQIFYGTLDMTFHDRYQSVRDTTSTVANLQNAITPFRYLEGTHFQASFGHLNGYAAGYYGYLWAKVFAEDIFSVFKTHGILDESTGRRLYKQVLAKGKMEPEQQLVETFLGRSPSQEAFLKSLGI